MINENRKIKKKSLAGGTVSHPFIRMGKEKQ